MIRRLIQCCVCVILCPFLAAQQAAQPASQLPANQVTKAVPATILIPRNTVIELDALEPVATATIGSSISLAVVNDVPVKGVTAIRAGSPLNGNCYGFEARLTRNDLERAYKYSCVGN